MDRATARFEKITRVARVVMKANGTDGLSTEEKEGILAHLCLEIDADWKRTGEMTEEEVQELEADDGE